MMDKPILIRQFVNRWYLYWAKSGQTIASFATQFEAYSARRAIIEHNKKKEESYELLLDNQNE